MKSTCTASVCCSQQAVFLDLLDLSHSVVHICLSFVGNSLRKFLTFTKILIALPPALQKRGCTEIFNKHDIVHCLAAISSGDLQLKAAGIAGSTLLTHLCADWILCRRIPLVWSLLCLCDAWWCTCRGRTPPSGS